MFDKGSSPVTTPSTTISTSSDESPETTLASTAERSAVVKTSGDPLYMRSGASTNHKVLKSIPNGTSVKILDKNEDGTWALVEYDGTTGWCSAKYLVEQ